MDKFNEVLWGTFADLEHRYRIPRSTGYAHLANGDFRSKRVHGRRLIDMRSVEAFLNRCPERPPKKVSREMTLRAFKSADVRARE